MEYYLNFNLVHFVVVDFLIKIKPWTIDLPHSTAHCPILIMASAWLGNNKHSFLSHWFDSNRVQTHEVQNLWPSRRGEDRCTHSAIPFVIHPPSPLLGQYMEQWRTVDLAKPIVHSWNLNDGVHLVTQGRSISLYKTQRGVSQMTYKLTFRIHTLWERLLSQPWIKHDCSMNWHIHNMHTLAFICCRWVVRHIAPKYFTLDNIPLHPDIMIYP